MGAKHAALLRTMPEPHARVAMAMLRSLRCSIDRSFFHAQRAGRLVRKAVDLRRSVALKRSGLDQDVDSHGCCSDDRR
jgi:hypothetical protein